jgi:SSS family solute:Na+ symporter
MAGKSLPFWAIGMSLIVSDIGAIDFVGTAGQAYRYGIVVANFDWLGSVPGMIIAAFIFIPFYWKSGIYTIPEYLGRRYNQGAQLMASITWILFYTFGLGVTFWASGVMLNTLMGWPIWVCILVTGAVVGFYTVSGGLSAVVMTDVVQMIIMFIGAGAMVFIGMTHVGGWDGLVEKISAKGPEFSNHFDLIFPSDTETPYPWTGILFGLTFVMANAYWIGNQSIVQRCLAAKSEWHAKASLIMGAVLKMFIPILIIFPGIIAIVTNPGLENGDQAVPLLIKNFIPPGLLGLLFAAFFAALMSTLDSTLNSTATLWSTDIYKKYLVKKGSDKHYLKVGKITTVAIMVLAMISSPLTENFPGIYVAIQTLLSFFQGPIFGVLLIGMLWKRTTQWGGFYGLTGGIAIAVLMYLFKDSLFTISDPFLYVSWWSFVASLIIAFVVTLFTDPWPMERIKGLVFNISNKE